MPMNKPASQLPLLEYWKKFSFQIARNNKWACTCEECPSYAGDACLRSCTMPALRRENTPTLRSYTNYIERLDDWLDDKPISELSLEDIKFALTNIRTDSGDLYSEGSLATARTALNAVFSYAAARSDAYNIMKGLYIKRRNGTAKDYGGILHLWYIYRNKPICLRESLSRELEQCNHKTKSLTIFQMEKLTQLLWDDICRDGRVCLLALMLYTGVRPAEARALCWQDIVPLHDHPEVSVINIHRIRRKDGKIVNSPKTDNGYRRIPIHPELADFLAKRKEFVRNKLREEFRETDPIGCFKNKYDRPCRDYELALKADEYFSKIRLRQEDMYIYALQYELEKLNGHTAAPRPAQADMDREQQLTLYVLRRNFWTWLEASTGLTDMEKRYVMGHDMKIDDFSYRRIFNDEDRLHTIYLGMCSCTISSEHHQKLLTLPVDGRDTIYVQNAGLRTLVIPKHLLKAGGRLILEINSLENGDPVVLTASRDLPLAPKLTEHRAFAAQSPPRINCELEQWQAHRRHHSRLRTSADTADIM